MDLPDEIRIRGVLAQGGAFKARLTHDDYARFYFVLNHNPEEDTLIVLSTSTTHFELHRSCAGGDDVHIPLSHKDYSPFFKDCLICCDRPKHIQKARLLDQLRSDKYDILPPLPDSVLERIKNGIAKSSRVPPVIKKLVLGTSD